MAEGRAALRTRVFRQTQQPEDAGLLSQNPTQDVIRIILLLRFPPRENDLTSKMKIAQLTAVNTKT